MISSEKTTETKGFESGHTTPNLSVVRRSSPLDGARIGTADPGHVGNIYLCTLIEIQLSSCYPVVLRGGTEETAHELP